MTGQIFSVGAATFVLILLLGLSIWRIFKPGAILPNHPVIFLGLIFLCFLTLRLPVIGWAREINVDESQMVAQGHRFLSHPVPWRDVDGTTSGPLDSWLLSAPMLLGAPANWSTARAVLWATQCATIVFVYLALRCFGTREDAQLALMPTVLFYVLATDGNTTHYSSETLPVLLVSIMVWLLCRAWTAEKFSRAGLFFTGFLAGCVPFSKLQAAPMAAYLLAAGIAMTFIRDRKKCKGALALMLFGAALMPVILLGMVAANGAGGDFWKSYILAPAAYTRDSFGTKLRALWYMFTSESSFRGYWVSALAGVVALAVTMCFVRNPRPGRKLLVPLVAVIGLGVVTVGCLLVAGKGWLHYLLLMVPALAVFFGIVMAVGKKLLLAEEENDPNIFPKPVHWFLAAFALIVCLQISKAPACFNMLREFFTTRGVDRKSFVARRVLLACRPGDTISVWGWMPAYYVETGLLPATRDAIGHFIIEDGPYRDYYRQRYLKDLEESRPAVFVDAMADGVFHWTWPERQTRRHESFPALNKFIEENYSLWLTVHFMGQNGPGLPVRIYVLRQRMADLNLRPEELNISPDPLLAPD